MRGSASRVSQRAKSAAIWPTDSVSVTWRNDEVLELLGDIRRALTEAVTEPTGAAGEADAGAEAPSETSPVAAPADE